MDKFRRIKKFNKFIIFLLFIVYITLYIFQLTGYYEYELNQKKNLTEEQIKKFEQDIKSGAEVDIKDYLEKDNNYSNHFSKIGYNASAFFSNITEKTIVGFFKIISNLVEE